MYTTFLLHKTKVKVGKRCSSLTILHPTNPIRDKFPLQQNHSPEEPIPLHSIKQMPQYHKFPGNDCKIFSPPQFIDETQMHAGISS